MMLEWFLIGFGVSSGFIAAAVVAFAVIGIIDLLGRRQKR